jgi:HK97 gp10 family phage protein
MAQAGAIELFGDKELQKALFDIGGVGAIRAMRPAMSKALTPVRRLAKSKVSGNKRSGALQKAISKKIAKRRNAKAWAKVYVKSAPQMWNGKNINPAKYAHLLEFGTRHSRAHPFLRTAMAESKGVIQQILVREGWAELTKQVVLTARRRGTNKSLKAFRQSRGRARRIV